MIEIYFKTVRDLAFQKIEDFRVGSWIHIKHATLDSLEKIAELTHIELSDLRDSLDKYELPRVENTEEYTLFFLRHPGKDELGLYTKTLTILLTPNYLITIAPDESEVVEQLIHSQTVLNTTQKAKLLLHILMRVTQEFTISIKRVRQSILSYRTTVESIDSEAILVFTQNEEVLNQYLMALVPLRLLLETMTHGRYLSFYEKDLDLLDDLMNAIRQSEDICRVNIKSIRSLRDSYQIIFTNNVNRTIKLLTALTIIFSIPTIIASLYGMNVPLPFQESSSAFGYILAATMGISLLSVWIFSKKKWI